jgi:MFS family permease
LYVFLNPCVARTHCTPKTYGTRFIGNDWCYRLPFVLPIIPAILMFIAIFFLPFSPRWLSGKGRDQEALEVLCFLRRLSPTDPRVQAEWITIRAEAVHNREALLMRHPSFKGSEGLVSEMKLESHAWIDMFRSNVIRRTMIGISIMFFQQFVGINAVSFFPCELWLN